MNFRKILLYSFLGMTLLFFTVQCVQQAKNMGQVRAQPKEGNEVTIQMLQENRQDYIIHKDGPYGGIPIAVMFDPKNDDKTITTDPGWDLIADQKALSDAIGWLKSRPSIPRVYNITGPNDQVFGYVYTYTLNLPINVINDKKIFVERLVN